MELGSSQTPPVLDYNLPQSTSFVANVYLPLSINSAFFKPEFSTAPATTYYTKAAARTTSEIQQNIDQAYAAMTADAPADTLPTSPADVKAQFGLADIAAKTPYASTSSSDPFNVMGRHSSAIADAAKNAKPATRMDLNGKVVTNFVPEVASVVPRIMMVEHYRVNTYLGDYGAGRTVKTFSLLPGEKTVISVKTFKQLVQSKKQIENVLDSFSEDSSTDLENIVQAEDNYTSLEDKTTMMNFQVSGGINIIPGGKIAGIKIDASGSASQTVNSVRSSLIKKLNSSISKQSQKSNNTRKIEVNTEIDVTQTESEETSIVRSLENINKSRTLNFVFRQLNQELITLIYLDDVSFVFTNGYDEVKRVAKLDGLLDMLLAVITNPTDAGTVHTQIINQLANVFDYTGTRQSFIEKITETINDADTGSPVFSSTYWRKDADFSQTAEGVTVNGVIKNVTKRIIPTDSMIVDAMLGQGEALDCYNMRLQDSAAINAALENDKIQLGLDVIDAQTTATDKADKFNMVFKTLCCPDVECGCNSTPTP